MEVDARDIRPDDTQREELSSRENGDDRSQKWKPRHRAAFDKEPDDDEQQHNETNQTKNQSNQRCKVEWYNAHAGHKISGMGQQPEQAVM
ncbi:uncharacterized protein METZ01_LOCUS483618 [marine metagenome]|uniref:Uncharacterized protein n=1 Tax=marine metagenome TaxID=408172 RepID=A0A383CF57_9ZZZZ